MLLLVQDYIDGLSVVATEELRALGKLTEHGILRRFLITLSGPFTHCKIFDIELLDIVDQLLLLVWGYLRMLFLLLDRILPGRLRIRLAFEVEVTP